MGCALVCAGVRWCAQVRAGVRGWVLECTEVHGCLRVYVWVGVGWIFRIPTEDYLES